jgi:polyisoprenoid-binding protein YceI
VSAKRRILIGAIACASLPAIGAADTFTIDPDHTFPSLEMSHMGLSIWRGKFNKTSGTVTFDPQARTGSVDVDVDTASIDFGLESMHEVAVTANWLDVAKFPTMHYTGTLRFDGERPVAIDGRLTLRGVTQPLVLTIEMFDCIDHPYYKKRACGADASGELNRADYGMTLYSDGEAGKIRMRIQVEGIKAD